jgi:hypothetical protein
MNSFSKFAVIAMLGLAAHSTLSAQTVVNMCGSSAGRASTHQAILAILDGETFAFSGNADVNLASRAIYKGNLGSGGPLVTIRTNYGGSANGVSGVTGGSGASNQSYINVGNTTSGAGTYLNPPAIGNDTIVAGNAANHIAFSDVFQGSTNFKSPTLDDANVLVLPFAWMKSQGAPAALNNMTSQQARILLTSGIAPLSAWTGVDTDSTTSIYSMGRNNDSGTRITTFAETGHGINTLCNHWAFTSTGTEPAAVNVTLTTVGNAPGTSGANCATALGGTVVGGGFIVAYIGLGDGDTADANGADYIPYNGVPYTADNVYQGYYTLWSYLHQFKRTSLAGVELQVYNALKAELLLNPGTSGLDVDLMKVTRAGDGQNVTRLSED